MAAMFANTSIGRHSIGRSADASELRRIATVNSTLADDALHVHSGTQHDTVANRAAINAISAHN